MSTDVFQPDANPGMTSKLSLKNSLPPLNFADICHSSSVRTNFAVDFSVTSTRNQHGEECCQPDLDWPYRRSSDLLSLGFVWNRCLFNCLLEPCLLETNIYGTYLRLCNCHRCHKYDHCHSGGKIEEKDSWRKNQSNTQNLGHTLRLLLRSLLLRFLAFPATRARWCRRLLHQRIAYVRIQHLWGTYSPRLSSHMVRSLVDLSWEMLNTWTGLCICSLLQWAFIVKNIYGNFSEQEEDWQGHGLKMVTSKYDLPWIVEWGLLATYVRGWFSTLRMVTIKTGAEGYNTVSDGVCEWPPAEHIATKIIEKFKLYSSWQRFSHRHLDLRLDTCAGGWRFREHSSTSLFWYNVLPFAFWQYLVPLCWFVVLEISITLQPDQ